ncbi:bifunctional (p)ppGpp synthetase/guanosine-3',5'-bis(diphosphate) 3'-pyrophosphohydrolase [Candidatus Gracilibacteria bacterium]|nr:bifunctional (p)ppGpp synthetase/guanosine-3',5'-bis(diphosphate) 3'-pyrophosphohydrolase [Candidatus Gracilibacteria bacterium]
MVDQVMAKIVSYNEGIDQEKVRRVLDFAKFPYALEILEIILPLKPDDNMILAALLEPIYVEGGISDKEVKDNFGMHVFTILQNVKRLLSFKYAKNDKSNQLEVLRKLFMAMAKDIRVILIGLAVRLYKMNHLLDIIEDAGERVLFAKETLDLYVPISSRLGVYRIKTRLEDLAFKFVDTRSYEAIVDQLSQFGDSRKVVISLITHELEDFLKARGYADVRVLGRLKSVSSINKKLKKKGVDAVEELYDIFAMRVILPAQYDESEHEIVDHLYGVLGMIHGEWKPISRRFKDYIAVPKPNGYRSLHTVVLGLAPKDRDQPVEIQIRSDAMHSEAEYGIASHWLYKTVKGSLKSQIDWLRGLERIRDDLAAGGELLGLASTGVFSDRIFVLTPRGEVKDLSVGATPIDFAYLVHTDVGNRCVMAKVDGEIVALDYELNNGDVVEIVTKKDAEPKLKWLSTVVTSQAKSKIKAYFSRLNRDHHLKEGRRLMNAQLARLGHAHLDQNYSILKKFVGKKLTVALRESLIVEVGQGSKLASDVVRKVFPYEDVIVRKVIDEIEEETKFVKGNDLFEEEILVGGEDGLPVKIAKCCQPHFAEDIMAYVTRGNSVTIHASKCAVLEALGLERKVSASWSGLDDGQVQYKYRVKILIKVLLRLDLMRDVTSIMSNVGIYVVDVSTKQTSGRVHNYCFVLDLENLDQFDLLLDKLEEVPGVLQVSRVL